MELVRPDLGLVFWMVVSFSIVLFILGKYAWPAILNGLKEREQTIADALAQAEKAREEMKNLTAKNEELIRQAKDERDALLKSAKDVHDKIINEAKEKAQVEAAAVIASAKEKINNEKMAAITELKNEIANLSIEISEKVLAQELADKAKQKALVENLVKEIKFS